MEVLLTIIIITAVGWCIWRKISNKKTINRTKELKQKLEVIEKQINIQKEEWFKLQEINQELEKQNQKISQENQLCIEKVNGQKNIIEALDATIQEKEKTLLNEKEKINTQLEEYKEECLIKKQAIQNELDSLENTRKAVIEANVRENKIKESQEDYCLRLPMEEQKDVVILSRVKNKVSKPRAIGMCIWSNYYLPVAKEILPKILGDNENVIGIYKITNQLTQQCYIGQAKDIKKRVYEHMRAGCGVDAPVNNQLYSAMQKDGLENFSIEILEKCSAEELDQKEKYYINLYKSQVYGYNILSGNTKK